MGHGYISGVGLIEEPCRKYTAIHSAVEYCTADYLRHILQQYGRDIDGPDGINTQEPDRGYTALHMAVSMAYYEKVNILHLFGADPYVRSDTNLTSMDLIAVTLNHVF
jgi:ankyrin repeat protein